MLIVLLNVLLLASPAPRTSLPGPVSNQFAIAFWDNTRTKDILNQDNPEPCERIARSIGTHQMRELTVRLGGA